MIKIREYITSYHLDYNMPHFLIIAIFLSFIFNTNLYSQKKSSKAVRTSAEIKIDGVLNETDWNNAVSFDNFTGFYPIFAKEPSQKTEVRVLYDDHAIYFAAILYDAKPDSIYTELTMRDKDNGNVDYFALSLNPNNDGQNIYEFIVSAANVQTDIRISEIDDDYAWDAVWYSAVSIVANGWIVEIEIPYSAIRFPKLDKQNWSVN
ncbi:MAG: carbohydrate binding family 9 domain-containing protein, partial [Bacteroidales bacterium]|nr:carbohydrate binding family 9 domain-containing protein [Bacteroidales bacterium]